MAIESGQIRLDPRTLKAVQRFAEEQGVSVEYLIERVIGDYIEQAELPLVHESINQYRQERNQRLAEHEE